MLPNEECIITIANAAQYVEGRKKGHKICNRSDVAIARELLRIMSLISHMRNHLVRHSLLLVRVHSLEDLRS